MYDRGVVSLQNRSGFVGHVGVPEADVAVQSSRHNDVVLLVVVEGVDTFTDLEVGLHFFALKIAKEEGGLRGVGARDETLEIGNVAHFTNPIVVKVAEFDRSHVQVSSHAQFLEGNSTDGGG